MVKIDRLTITVTIEGDADAGERIFARLFDKYSELRDSKVALQAGQADGMERDRALSPVGGRR